MKMKIWILLGLSITLFQINLASAQDEPGEVNHTFALTNVHITTSPGNLISNGTVIIKDGLIQSVGRGVSIPSDAQIIPSDTMYVYAGFIDGLSHTGLKKPNDCLLYTSPSPRDA